MRRPGRMIAEVLSSIGKKPVTVRYPFVKIRMPEKFRGKLTFSADKCIGCKLCMRDCPTNAIQIRKVGDKQFEADIDLSRCIYCAQCVDSCPKKALAASGEFELAQLTRKKLRITYKGQPRPAEPATAGQPASAVPTSEPSGKPPSEPQK